MKHCSLYVLLVGVVMGLLVLDSCQGQVPSAPDRGNRVETFEAIVVGEDISCRGAWVIEFSADLERIAEIAGQSQVGNKDYLALNLPNGYKKPGTELVVSIRAPLESEIPVCNAHGVTYPEIMMTSVHSK